MHECSRNIKIYSPSRIKLPLGDAFDNMLFLGGINLHFCITIMQKIYNNWPYEVNMTFNFIFIGLKIDRLHVIKCPFINLLGFTIYELNLCLVTLNLICLYQFVEESWNKTIIAVLKVNTRICLPSKYNIYLAFGSVKYFLGS